MTESTFFLPPEWAEQSGIILTWPNENNTWIPSLSEIEKIFVNIATAISHYEKVLISCLSNNIKEHIKKLLQEANANLDVIYFFIAPSNDVWARDHAPITVLQNGKPLLLDFTFNAWGNKYESNLDNALTRNLHQQGAFQNTPIKTLDFVLEGGSIEVDGKGTLLTTSRCLLNPSRNPNDTRDTISEKLKSLLGIQRILWLEQGGIEGDDTDGHIDTLVRFTDPHTLCYVQCQDDQDEHFQKLHAMEKQLKTFIDYQGNPYRLVTLPWPKPRLSIKTHERIPNTYANFLIINGAVLVPLYDDPQDEKALSQIQICFPDRKIIGIRCEHLIEQFGSLHCVTMQLPKEINLGTEGKIHA